MRSHPEPSSEPHSPSSSRPPDGTLFALRPGSDGRSETTAQAQARRLVRLETQIDELERSRRRSLRLGPILLLALANVTPLVVVRAKNGPDEQFTLFQLALGAVKALPAWWFLLLGVIGLACIGAAVVVGRSTGRRTDTRPVVAPAVALLVVLALLVLILSGTGGTSTTYLALTPATALGAAAAIWLLVGASSMRP